MKEKIRKFLSQNWLKIIIIFGVLFYPITSMATMCLIFSQPLPRQQLQIQGVATINNDALPVGTKINYSIKNPIVCGGTWGGEVLIIDQTDGHYGPAIISFPSFSDVYLNLEISEIPQGYLGDRVIKDNHSLSFTITPNMIGTTITQDLAFQVSLVTPTPTPVPTPISTPIPTPPKYPFLGGQTLTTPTPTPILISTPRLNNTMSVEVSSSLYSYQDNLTLISWVIHNDPWPDLNGVKIDVAIDGENAWSGSYGMSTSNPYSISYAYALTPTLHTVKTTLIDQAGNSHIDTFSFIPTLISTPESTIEPTPTPVLTPTPALIPTPTPTPEVLGAFTGSIIIPTLPANPTRGDYQNLLNASIQRLAHLRSLMSGQVAGASIGYQFTHNLQFGDTGEDVTQLQTFLKNQGVEIYPEGLVTGYFGSLTQSAIQRFQVKYDIVSSGTPESTGYGYVGPKTRAKINSL